MRTSALASPTVAARGRWIPWAFVGGMLTVVAVNAVLVFFAMSSWSGVATSRAFERGIAYNRVLAAAAAEDALGWQAEIAYRSGSLVVALRDADGRPIDRAVVAVEAERPLERHGAVSATLQAAGEGRYVAKVDDLRAGQWDIRLSVAHDGAAAHLTRRIVVR
jgi:nitrogen fixation protein FixH